MKKPTLALACLFVLVAVGSSLAAAEEPLFTADKHTELGLDCTACHGDETPGSVAMEQCLTCHGPYDELASRTEDQTYNPHDSHYGEMDCSICHKGHEEDTNFCSTCHDLSM